MAPTCPHCGSNQVSEWSNTETSNGGIGTRSVRYFCRNCKKDFTVTETRQYAPGMTWLLTFDSGISLGDLERYEFYRNPNGAIYLRHCGKMGKVFSLIITPGCHIKYRWSGDNREHREFTTASVLRMNSELTKQACKKEAFSNIYSQRGDCFSLYSYKPGDPQRDEMALFLNGVLCTEAAASEGCYVATCVYGSYDCPEVWTLRRFRDDTLGKRFWGRMFIRAYYAVSPAMVQCFGNAGWFRKLWRGVLDWMVRRLNGRGVESTPYVDKGWR